MELSCKKCRVLLIGESSLCSGHAFANASKCSSYYAMECPLWLISGGKTEGKMQCPNCQYKIGSWNWAGVQCSCGEWVTPGFQFHCSKVDNNKYQNDKVQNQNTSNSGMDELL